MIPFTLSEIVQVLHGELIGEDKIIRSVTINSKKIADQCLFIALIGKNFDSHCFVSEAILGGACAVLVNDYLALNVSQLVVKDTNRSLLELAAWVRRQVSSKIIAITGSSGKTSVKEMTASILFNRGNVIATEENYNNEIGVALTLLRLTYEVNFLVIEIGANCFGAISLMSNLVKPDIVLINNIFPAHLLGFGSLMGIARAKGEIFSGLSFNGVCVLNLDNNAWFLWKELLFVNLIVTFSICRREGVDFFASNIIFYRNKISFSLHTPTGSSFVALSMLGYHSVSNALAAVALAFSVGATLKDVVLGLERMFPLPGRLFPIVLGSGKLLLDDTYNANIGSMISAVDVLKRMSGYRVIVIGDIAELGNFEVKYHCNIGKLISETNINLVLSIGYLSFFVSYWSLRGEHFFVRNTLIFRLVELVNRYDKIVILIKGSRNMFMDQLVIELKDLIGL